MTKNNCLGPTDSNTPLHLTQPDYPIPYRIPKTEEIKEILKCIHRYLATVTPARLIDSRTEELITDYNHVNEYTKFEPGDFRLTSYEWGVTYSGMLLAGEVTGDPRFIDYSIDRLKLIIDLANKWRTELNGKTHVKSPVQSVLNPLSLDDAGTMCTALIKAKKKGIEEKTRPLINNYITFISKKQFRLNDGTFARNRPKPKTLWLDDLFMSVPALTLMGKLTGQDSYYDDAVKQVIQFSNRMFNKKKNFYMHGWVEDMTVHPEFYWARANGWALMAKIELLDGLPEDHPSYSNILNLIRAHVTGLAGCQSGIGLWHQLLDRNDSYLETSSSAMFVYSIVKAVNRGWIDPFAYGPVALHGWNAIETKVDNEGKINGTCVGTGMGFDFAFYYFRPVSIYAAHSYGPVLLAGSEIIRLLKKSQFEIIEKSIQYK